MRKTLLYLGGTILFIALVAFSWSLSLTRADEPENCVARIASFTEAERAACVAAAGGPQGVNPTIRAIAQQTAAARPTRMPGDGLTAEAIKLNAPERPTARPTTPPGVILPESMVIRTVVPEHMESGELSYRYNRSVWRVGAVLDGEYAHAFYVTSRKDMCALFTTTSNNESTQYRGMWECPEPLDPLVITNVTAPDGTVLFTTADGRSGTFDLSTKTWTLDGSPWLAPYPPPAPTVAPYPEP